MTFDFDRCLEKGRQLQAHGASNEDLLQFFRQAEASMLESVKLIKQLKQISLREAQDIVHFSATWTDHQEGHDQLQEAVADALRKIGQESREESS